jgi:hypothetical protein
MTEHTGKTVSRASDASQGFENYERLDRCLKSVAGALPSAVAYEATSVSAATGTSASHWWALPEADSPSNDNNREPSASESIEPQKRTPSRFSKSHNPGTP